jgi:hypothetical protein
MTVKDLIDLLSKEDPNMRVVVDGYESGYDEFNSTHHVNIISNPRKKDSKKDDAWWEGEFCFTNNKASEKALLFPRKS